MPKPSRKRSRNGQQDGAKRRLKTTLRQAAEDQEQRTRKIRMRLTKSQKKTICNWMGAARFTYNKCLEAVKKERFPLNQSLLRDRFVTEKELRPETYA